ncbi:MAG: AroB-related putative sugar phosphate phospholyase (cyclizing) [Eubacteriales bacterium]
MNIKSHIKDYIAEIEPDFSFFAELKTKKNSLFVVDRNVFNLYRTILFQDIDESLLFILDASEEYKTMETVLQICEKFTLMSAKRNALLISIGGGIVQDITGFAANILYRGISWIFIPTTLLACCDSCIGSKTSLNYKQFKNLLGTFYPPDELYICSKFFDTLTDLDFMSGLGEVVKFNVMSGEAGVDMIERNMDLLLARDSDTLNRFVELSLHFKKPYIEKDEFDKGERINLNFAHTFGHAIESVSDYNIPHGSAVAIGMLIANRISVTRGYMDADMAARIEKICRKILTLHIEPEYFKLESIINAIKKDKKQISESLTAVLLSNNMNIQVYHDIHESEIEEAIRYVLKQLDVIPCCL